MIEQVDLRVHDLVALDEIELYSEVLSAVAASDRPLTDEELDQVLGLRPVPVQRTSRVPEHDVGAAVRETQRLVQFDRRGVCFIHVEHGLDEATRP